MYGIIPRKIATRNITVAVATIQASKCQTVQLYRSGWQYCVDQPHQVVAFERMQQLGKVLAGLSVNPILQNFTKSCRWIPSFVKL
jgi:hypothetical protein